MFCKWCITGEFIYKQVVSGNFIYIVTVVYGSIIGYYFLFLVPLHEFGHLFFGKISGFSLISFQLYGITIINENGKIKISKYFMSGSIGQCLMYPPSYEVNRKNSFLLYSIGGILIETVMMLVFLLIALHGENMNAELRLIFLICSFMEFISIIVNTVPRGNSKINNDGLNTYYLLKDQQAVKSYYSNLRILKEIQDGKTYQDFPEEVIIVPDNADLSNVIIAWQKMYESYYYMDLRKWYKAAECIEKIEDGCRNKAIRETILSEKLFLYIKMDKSISEINALHDKVKKTLNHNSTSIDMIRVNICYEMCSGKKTSYETAYKKFSKIIESYPNKGEVKFNAGLIREIVNYH